jgi:ADP-ribose pyrophosphatase YjhB (NUDIX family)
MFNTRRIQHCRACGTAVAYRVPPDDNRERAICPACGEVHYENPLNVVGTVPVWGDQVLLCRRNIEPRFGFWTLPAGFMELGESAADGALRETVEEAGARVEMQALFTVLSVVRVGQVHLYFRARMLDTTLAPGPGDHRGTPVQRSRDPLGPVGLSHRAPDAGTLLCRPPPGRVWHPRR